MDMKCVVVCYGLDVDNVSQVFHNKAEAKSLFESSKNDGWLYVLNYSRTLVVNYSGPQPISAYDYYKDLNYMIDGEFGDIEYRGIAVQMAMSEFIEDE